MTLREFHIVFITASIILSFGTAAWCLLTPNGSSYLSMGIFSLAMGAGLLLYAASFFKKLKRLEQG